MKNFYTYIYIYIYVKIITNPPVFETGYIQIGKWYVVELVKKKKEKKNIQGRKSKKF